VRLSSPVMPGPVFCCAWAGNPAVSALNKKTHVYRILEYL
jgi:hypothetical protein